jgi:NADH-quinone oxidoreductase subunit L
VREKGGMLTAILERKYGFDEFNQWFFADGAVKVGKALWKFGDVTLIDGLMVNGTAKLVGWIGSVTREIQSGRIYHYAFSMILGVLLLTLFGMLAAG